MAEQWIDAATARQLVIAPPIGVSGVQALMRRAHSGLVKTKARLLVIEGRQAEGAILPPEVWTSDPYAMLQQNWGTGDFSGSSNELSNGPWQAFGVTFALSGVLEMLPAAHRPLAARSLSVVSNPAWLTARAAFQFVYEKAGVSINGAGVAILDQAGLGFVAARAVLAQRFDSGIVSGPARWDREPDWEAREWDVPSTFWREFTRGPKSHQSWERGIFAGPWSGPRGPCLTRLEGVHFSADSLQVLLPTSGAALLHGPARGEAAAKDNLGGRPPAAWWDDMWCDVWGSIYEGKLIPKTQAAIEAAMHEWAQERGQNPAESTVRAKARKLFKVLKRGENPPH